MKPIEIFPYNEWVIKKKSVLYLYQQEAFEDKFNRAGIPAENDTRWNSTLRQVRAVVKKGMTPLNTVSAGQERRELVFTARDWSVLKELLEVLEPFADATDELSGDKVSFYSGFSRCESHYCY